MASLGHIAVGMAAARVDDDGPRPQWRSMALWSALSLLPDADVIGLAFGIDYAAPWGHRGATHSLTFAIILGLLIGVAAPRFHRPRLRTGLVATVVLASHGLLDTLTDGGLGCALLWPFDVTRYFAPWRPIPVSPIGLDFLSPQGVMVALAELVLFAPILVFALRPTRIKRFLVPVWAVLVWLMVSGDPIREDFVGVVFRENTEYASGFSDQAFRAIKPGDSHAHVRQLLSAPLGEWWDYEPRDVDGCPFVYLESDVVGTLDHLEVCAKRGIRPGMSRGEVEQALGAPDGVCWRYTRSAGGRPYRVRVVCFSDGKVADVVRQWQPR